MLPKKTILRLTQFIGLHGLMRFFHRKDITVLMYHGVVHDDAPFDSWTQVRENRFVKQMEYLKKYYEVISIEGAENVLKRQGRSNKPQALITFDDGYRNNYSVAFPILKYFGFPAVIFLTTKFIDSQELFWFDKVISSIQVSNCSRVDLRDMKMADYQFPLVNRSLRWDAIQNMLTDLKALDTVSRDNAVEKIVSVCSGVPSVFEHLGVLNSDEIQKMTKSGLIEFGSHTHGHEILTKYPVDKAGNSIETSIGVIKRITGKGVRCFAYPNGDYNEDIIQVLKELNVEYAFSISSGFWNEQSKCYEIPRVAVGGYDSEHYFSAALSVIPVWKSEITNRLMMQ